MSMQVIERIELASAQSSIEFTGIAADYTDLLLLVSIRESRSDLGSGNGVSWTMTFNSSTANRSQRSLYYTTSPFSGSSTVFYMWSTTEADTANTFNNGQIYIPNYASSNYKSFSTENMGENNGTSGARMTAGLWSDTSAITSIQMYPSTANFVAGSSATLFGITAGSDGTTTVS